MSSVQNSPVPTEDLRAAGYGDEVEAVATSVADFLDDGVGSNVAIVSDPYAGRGSLASYADSLLDEDVTRIRLDAVVDETDVPSLPDDGALILENCHYLFTRRIDGFAPVETFLERLALSDQLVVTTWNRYAWGYLDDVRSVSDSFPVVVEIPPLDRTEIAAVVEAQFGPDLPDFVDTGSAGRIKTVVFDRHSVDLLGGRTLDVPYPKPNTAWVSSWFESDADESIEAVVFEKIRRVSNGNPGVATTVWERSVRDGQIAPGYVTAPTFDLSLDDDSAFLLWTLVTMESIDQATLTDVLGDRGVATDLQYLDDQGVLSVDDGQVTVTPEALHIAVTALRRRKLL